MEDSFNGRINVGTGRSALCDPNFALAHGDPVDMSKAIIVNENWQLSRRCWSDLTNEGLLLSLQPFINSARQRAFAYGEDQVDWPRKFCMAICADLLLHE